MSAELISINNCITSRIAYVDTTDADNFVNGSLPAVPQSDDNSIDVALDQREQKLLDLVKYRHPYFPMKAALAKSKFNRKLRPCTNLLRS